MARVLIVEDDKDLSTMVRDLLEAAGHEVEAVFTGTDAVERLKTRADLDLLILDWDLPGIKGPEICKGLRADGSTLAVLMLTGRGGLDEKEEGFDSGADDYLTKPFAVKELSMRVKALLRRAPVVAEKNADIYATLAPGGIIDGKYLLESQIGRGGMGLIFKAKHLSMDRTVVLKVMQSHLLTDTLSVERFQQEQRLLAKITHPNVVTVYDVGAMPDGTPFIVMEYLCGESVYSLIKRQGALEISTAVSIMINACMGLQAAHNQGIVHRDLKPENILLLADLQRADWVKVVDFGTAILSGANRRLTEANMIIGTAEYMAPEQLRDEPVDCRADIYALGVVLFYLLSKDAPFHAAHTEALLLKVVMEQPDLISSKRADIAAGSPIEWIISKAMQKDPNDRFQSADEMRAALEQILQLIIQ